MKHTKRKLVLIMLISMVVAFVVIAVAFRLIINAHVRNRADSSISQYMDKDKYDTGTEETESAMVVVSFTHKLDEPPYDPYDDDDDDTYFWEDFWDSLFDEDSWSTEEAMSAYYSDEILAWWEEEETEPNTLYKVEIDDDKQLYVSWKYDDVKPDTVRFYYVNVSSEEQLIRTVSISLYIIMAVCLAGACLAGLFLGKKIETDQNRQKQFFENASHELKTPLMSIQGYAEGLQAGITDPDKATKVILSETDKMTGLVNDILSISRLESGAYKLRKEPVYMPEFLSECLTSMEAAIMERRIRVGFDVSQVPLEADRVQLEKAVRNILTNAIRYARSEIRILYDGKRLVIWDDGTPISEESLKHLFERFYTGQNGNTGIGMSLTKEIVEQHGWKIKAENTAAGAQFVITF